MAFASGLMARCAVTTWNVWGVPFASPLIFHRHQRWRSFHDQQLLELLAKHESRSFNQKELLVCCFQEVWSFWKGPLMDYTASRPAESLTQRWENGVLILGILCRFCSCRAWDAAKKLFESVGSLHYSSLVGRDGMSLAWNSLVDSGLCILASEEPSEQGFVAYRHYPRRHEECLANKGLLWAWWPRGVLVLNTHFTTKRAVKLKQLEELRAHLLFLREDFRKKCRELEAGA